MDTLRIIILLVSIIGIILLVREFVYKRLDSTKTAEYLTIFGVIIGVLIYFDLAPQSVKIEKGKDLKIGSLEAFEKVARKGRSGSGLIAYPDFYFSTYVTNTGEIPVIDPVLKFKFENGPKNFNSSYLKAYLFNGINTIINNPAKLKWLTDTVGNSRIVETEDNFYQITLPPLPVNESISLIVGYEDCCNFDMPKVNLDSLVSGPIVVLLIERGIQKPSWKPDRTNLSNYKVVNQTKDIILDSKKAWFLLLYGYYN